MKRRSKTLLAACVVLIAVAILAYYQFPAMNTYLSARVGAQSDAASSPGGKPSGDPPGGRAMTVEAAPVRTGAVNVEVGAVGSLLANESVVIRPEIAGRIAEIHFSEGETVKLGAPLITLDAAELRAQLAESASSMRLNNLSFNRAKDLVQKKLLSRQEYDQAQANLSEAQARQAVNQARLDKTIILAPFDGTLGLRQISPGDYVQPGEDIVNLEDIGSLKLDFRIPESYLSKVSESQSVELGVDAFPEQTFRGAVYAIDPLIDATTRTVQLRARIPNPDKQLRPGMFARVTLVLDERPNALLIPEQALVPMGNERFVYKIADDKAVLQKVHIGQRRAGEVEILEGLAASDTVVTAGQQKIRDGAPVKVLQAAEDKLEEVTSRQSDTQRKDAKTPS